MTLNVLLSFTGALLYGGLAAAVIIWDRRSLVHRTFAVGMIALALEAALAGLSVQTDLPVGVVRWQRLRIVASGVLPGSWLLFSLSFARANYKEFVATWKWVTLAAFVFPLTLATLFGNSLFIDARALYELSGWSLRLGWSGTTFSLVFLLSAVLILMNLERTLRASAGSKRRRIKFMVLGLGSLFAVRIYTSSQVLLYSSVSSELEAVDSGALIAGCVLMSLSLVRAGLSELDIYLSQTLLYNSLTLLIVGIYLLAAGTLARAVKYFGGAEVLPFETFCVFLSLIGLTAILLSDQIRQQIRRFISRHFQRPRYDYRKEWTAFTRRTTSLVHVKNLCAAVTRTVPETFGLPSVTIWLLDETREHVALGGSTLFSEAQARNCTYAMKGIADLIHAMLDQQMPVDVKRALREWTAALEQYNPAHLQEAGVRYCVALVAGGEFLGLMTLGERATKEPCSAEDFDLLKTIADQAAASLLNLKLSERLMHAKEMEAFQTLSAFFVHDLKNLASTLSLALQNLPEHNDNPAFRHDLLRMISHSVAKINGMCNRLSLVGKTFELQRTEADLNGLVTATLASLNGSLKAAVVQDLQPVPRLALDSEQIQKVLINLILNANDTVGDRGEIRVTTQQQNGWVALSVSDNGCGMSKEFIACSLFHPFHTTKKQGLGIGLFHTKKIVDAHQGRIEVESEEGKGSTFRVLLPGNEAV